MRSAVALLANGGNKDRCKTGLAGGSTTAGTTVGGTVPEGQEDVESEKQFIKLENATEVDWYVSLFPFSSLLNLRGFARGFSASHVRVSDFVNGTVTRCKKPSRA